MKKPRANLAPIPAGEIGDCALWRKRAWLAAGIILFVRLVSLWFNNTELFFDEAQYWAWSREPAFGYFSKPPMLAWIIALVTGLFGNSEFFVRLASPVFHGATSMSVFAIGRELYDARTGFWSSIVYASLPAVTLSSTLISTDVPLLFFWSVSVYALIWLERSNRIEAALLLGLAFGGGLLSKYAMVYFLPCAALCGLAGGDRPILWRGRFWLAMAIGFAVLAPNMIWNYNNQFATIGHTGENIGWDGSLHFKAFAEFSGSQFGVFGPVLFGMYLVTAFRLLTEGMNGAQRFLLAFSAPVLLLILGQSLLSKAYANWAALTYVAGTILVTDIMVNRIPPIWNRVSLALHAIVFLTVAVAVAFSRAGQIPLPEGASPFARMHGARDIAGVAHAILQDKAANGQVFGGVLVDNRRLAALMHYYLRGEDIEVLSWRNSAAPADHFELKNAFQDRPANPVLYLTAHLNPHEIISAFGRAELLFEAEPQGEVARKVWFYLLAGYK